jgi:hypothetical protein
MPKPKIHREAKNMSSLMEPAWRPAPNIMTTDAATMVIRRPRYCDTVGIKGMAIRAPREYIAFKRPRRAELGLSKYSTQDSTACRLFIMDESNPEVHSTPRPQGTRMR